MHLSNQIRLRCPSCGEPRNLSDEHATLIAVKLLISAAKIDVVQDLLPVAMPEEGDR